MQQQARIETHQNRRNTWTNITLRHALNMVLIAMLAWFMVCCFFMGKVIYTNVHRAHHQLIKIKLTNTEFIRRFGNNALVSFSDYLNQAEHKLADVTGSSIQYLTKKIIDVPEIVARKLEELVAVFVFCTDIIFERLMIFIMAIPLMTGCFLIFAVDGLGQRDIRKFQGARESTFIFHQVKSLSPKLFLLLFMIYLAMPFSICPLYMLLVSSLMFSFLTMLAIKHYKKYV